MTAPSPDIDVAGRWRTSEDNRLRELYAAGVPLTASASALGRSQDAVNARRAALGIAARRRNREWSPLADAMLREATRAGVPATTLASQLHLPLAQLRARRRQLGLDRPPPRRYTPDDDRAIRASWAAGESLETLARRQPQPRVAGAPCPNTRTASPSAAPAMDRRRGRGAARRLRRRPHMRRDRPNVAGTLAWGGRGARPQARARELRALLERGG